MTDVQTSATIASLRDRIERMTVERECVDRILSGERESLAAFRAEVERLKEELAAASEREQSMNVQMGYVREESAGLRVRLERSETVLESTRQSIITACTGSGCLNANELRVALDTARERAGVLEAEVKAWHAAEHLRKDEPHNEFMRLAEARARTRETNAIDAAKFDQHKRGSIIECLDNVREAGGKAWDNVANPDAVLRGDDDKEHK